MEWQPIETAPKDGTRVLIYDGVAIKSGMFVQWFHYFLQEKQEGWGTNWDNEFQAPDEVMYPTHWMPLPAPPLPDNAVMSRPVGVGSIES